MKLDHLGSLKGFSRQTLTVVTHLRRTDKRRLAGDDSDDGEWRVPAAHSQPPARAAAALLPLFVPTPPHRTGPSPTPLPPRPAASEPLPVCRAADDANAADTACVRPRPAPSAPPALGAVACAGAVWTAAAAARVATPTLSAPDSERCPRSRQRKHSKPYAEACSRRAVGRPKRQAAAAAEAAAREARYYDDCEDGQGGQEGNNGEGFQPGFSARSAARQAAVAVAAAAEACEPPPPPGFEPCVRTTNAKPDGWTEYRVRCVRRPGCWARELAAHALLCASAVSSGPAGIW